MHCTPPVIDKKGPSQLDGGFTTALPCTRAELRSRLDALRERGAGVRDPLGLAYLASLWDKLSMAPPSIQVVLCQRFMHALAQSEARCSESVVQDGLGPNIPPYGSEPVTGTLAEAKNVPVKAFSSVFARRRGGGPVRPVGGDGLMRSEAGVNALAELNAYIRHASRLAPDDPSGHAPVPETALSGGSQPASGASSVSSVAPPAELKSARLFGETWSQLKTAQRVEEALRGAPENAGPFNPHLLVVKALSTLKGLSPAYLHHFVLRADNLLQLEQAAARLSSPPGKAKAARKRAPGQTSGTVS